MNLNRIEFVPTASHMPRLRGQGHFRCFFQGKGEKEGSVKYKIRHLFKKKKCEYS